MTAWWRDDVVAQEKSNRHEYTHTTTNERSRVGIKVREWGVFGSIYKIFEGINFTGKVISHHHFSICTWPSSLVMPLSLYKQTSLSVRPWGPQM